jgi:hypothetical protein
MAAPIKQARTLNIGSKMDGGMPLFIERKDTNV